MKILWISPGVNKKLDDYVYVLLYLKKMGLDITVMCSRSFHPKGKGEGLEYENMDGIPIYRIYRDFSEQSSYPIKQYNQVYNIAREFQPDIIFCSQQFNMFIAQRLKKDLHIPIVLLVEFANDPLKLVKRRWYLGLKPLAHPVADLYWRWLSKNTKAIITSYIGDKKYLKELSRYGTPVYYVPWCNHIPNEISTREAKKNTLRGIYVGSLSKWKNTDEFGATIPIILEHTPVKEFVIIGPRSGMDVVTKLKKQYGERVKYIESLPRVEALKLIQDSFFAYTPVKSGGWGFMGDSWGVKTPLIVTHNEYELKNRVDAMIVYDVEKIDITINHLYKNHDLYKALQREGYQRYRRFHTAESVGERCYEIMKSEMFQTLWDSEKK